MNPAGWYGTALACLALCLLCWPSSAAPRLGRSANSPVRRTSRPLVDVRVRLASSTRRQLVIVGALGGFAAGSLAGLLPAIAAAIAGSLGGITAHDLMHRRGVERRRAADLEALQVLADELRAGQDIATAMRAASTIDGAQLSPGLRSAAAAIQVGADPARMLVESGAGRDAESLAALYRLTGRYGVPLADAVEDLAMLSRQALARERRVKSLLAGPGATAMLLCLLPVFGIVMGEAIDARPIAFLTGSSIGGLVLIAGVILAATGVLWTRTLVTRVREAI